MFKNMPSIFIKVFRQKITNVKVESTIREKKYFIKGVLIYKSSRFGRAVMEVTMLQLSSFHGQEE